MGEYLTVKTAAKASFIEKKSEFIGHICPVKNADEAVEFIEYIKSQHRKARHNVYAYITRDGNISRYSDDGEPQGTGGVPVLEVIRKEGLTDVCVVVTRYFGGILLGGGGLVRAYSHACKLAVDAAQIMHMCSCCRVTFDCDYSLYGKLSYIFPEYEIKTVGEDFADEVKLTLLVKDEFFTRFADKVTDISGGKIVLNVENDLWEDFN
ncbi:MAG: YigZ family protein [Ruminococcus sp.]|nr:YigZ family protein [Ruminococcus sp.]